MTFVNHTIGGVAVGSAMAYLLYILFGINWWWFLVILNALVAALPDVASWIAWELSGKTIDRWKLRGQCHPPYDKETGHGKYDRFMKWWPSWGLHTWIIDSMVHPEMPRFIFPKFSTEWQNIVWIEFWPSHWNIQWTKWDILYVLLEFIITIIYVIIILYTII